MIPNKPPFTHNDLSDLQKTITNIIHKTWQDEKAECLESLFINTLNYTNKKLSALQKELLQQMEANECSSPYWRIFTMLVNINKNKDYGNFKAIIPKIKKINSCSTQNNFIGIFFHCSYEEFIKITDGKEYKIEIEGDKQSKTFYFKVEKSDAFVQEENVLFKAAMQYQYNFPPIYSPYSRRFAKITFFDPTVSVDTIKKSFFKNWEFYDAIEATTNEKTLVWNIWAGSTDDLQSISEQVEDQILKNKDTKEVHSIIPYNSKQKSAISRIIFTHPQNKYIIFDNPSENRLDIQRRHTINNKNITTSVTYSEELDLSHSLITISEFSESELKNFDLTQSFQNHYFPPLFTKQRVNSYADIYQVVSCFTQNPYDIEISEEIEIINMENLINTYNKSKVFIQDYHTEDRYYKYTNLKSEPYRTIKSVSKAACILTFNKAQDFKGNINFIEDYARYVLSYLNEKYPEFYWKGKKGWST